MGCDHGGHLVVVVVGGDVGGRGVDVVGREAVGGRGLLAVHCPLEAALAQPKRCLKSQLRHLSGGLSILRPAPPAQALSPAPNLEGGHPAVAAHPNISEHTYTNLRVRTTASPSAKNAIVFANACNHPANQWSIPTCSPVAANLSRTRSGRLSTEFFAFVQTGRPREPPVRYPCRPCTHASFPFLPLRVARHSGSIHTHSPPLIPPEQSHRLALAARALRPLLRLRLHTHPGLSPSGLPALQIEHRASRKQPPPFMQTVAVPGTFPRQRSKFPALYIARGRPKLTKARVRSHPPIPDLRTCSKSQPLRHLSAAAPAGSVTDPL